MPIVTIQSPSGESFQIEAPEGATDDQILAFAQSQGLMNNKQAPDDGAGVMSGASGLEKSIIGGIENVASMGASAITEPLAGLAGIAQSLNPFADKGAGAKAVESVRDLTSISPSTETGISQQQAIGDLLKPVAEANKSVGEFAYKMSRSPEVIALSSSVPILREFVKNPAIMGAAGETLIPAILEAIGVKGARKATSVNTPSANLVRKTLIDAAPDVEAIRSASTSIFKDLDKSGVVLNQKSMGRFIANLDRLKKKEGIDPRVTPEAAGAIDAAIESASSGNPMPINEVAQLRKIAKNSVVASDPSKARVGLSVVDEIDDFLDTIKSSDIASGSKMAASEVGKKYNAARKLWGRAKRSEMLGDAIEMGSSRKAGVEKGIRNELNNLINRKKTSRFLSKDDIAAIRKVTDGDAKQNISSLLGGMGIKFENSPSAFSGMVSGGLSGGLASSLGMSGVAVPLALTTVTVGTVAREVAKKITKNRAGFLRKTAQAGKNGDEVVKAYLMAVPKNKRNISDLSNLLLDPDIDLTTMKMIANETVRDAVNAAKFNRELLQASTALSVSQLNKEVGNDKE